MKNKTEIVKSVSGAMNKTMMKVRKHSPEILVVAGIAGTVVSAIIACKATTKVNKIVEDKAVSVHGSAGVPGVCHTAEGTVQRGLHQTDNQHSCAGQRPQARKKPFFGGAAAEIPHIYQRAGQQGGETERQQGKTHGHGES